ncbi:FlgD_ig domain-containing protein [Pycnococcus provasolii]
MKTSTQTKANSTNTTGMSGFEVKLRARMQRALLLALACLTCLAPSTQAKDLPCGDITSSITVKYLDQSLQPDGSYAVLMKCQVFVKSGASITFEPGVTVKAPKTGTDGKAPALVIEQGAKIDAQGTAELPITFTTSETLPPLSSDDPDSIKKQRGLWGGVIICGKAPTSKSGNGNSLPEVEGLNPSVKYGGDNSDDDSGILRYVRVWHGGAVIGADNEINGITFAGVGSSTIVEHVEVAYNADDGIEFFGGTVNVKYASVLFVEDDALDTDEGYQGKLQFVFVMLAHDSHHGAEMDSMTGGDVNSQPRSFPQLYNAMFVGRAGPRTSDRDDAMLRLREGTGGRFANIIITNIGSATPAVKQDQCGSEKRSSNLGTASAAGDKNYLWFDSMNIVHCGMSEGCPEMTMYDLDASCKTDNSSIDDRTMTRVDPELILLPRTSNEYTKFLDPRPVEDGTSYSSFYNPELDSFFERTGYRGAFGPHLWLARWSALADEAKLPDDIYGRVLNEDIKGVVMLKASDTNLLAAQVRVKAGATLNIEPGATISCYADDGRGKAPSLIIEQGAKIVAMGTASSPITFTSAKPLKQRKSKSWGGLIILGNAPISQGGTNQVEGIDGGTYGGNDPNDNSGTLQYVRVWYGGEVVGTNKEINGITFAGVGKGTIIDHIEVAFNFDDGVEFFGGTAQVKYLSLIANGDDSIDTDEGYQGKIQHAFVMLGSYGHHGVEMDSRTGGNLDSQPRSFPQLYNALFIGQKDIMPAKLKAARSSDDLSDGLMRLREGTGGEFGNLILTNVRDVGVKNDDCSASVRHVQTRADATSVSGFDYLFFSSKNIIHGANKPFDQASGCSGTLSSAQNANPDLESVPPGLDEDSTYMDPRPKDKSVARQNFDTVPSDGFFDDVSYKGGFDDTIWLSGWSFLADTNRLPRGSLPSRESLLCGDITSSRTISGVVFLNCQTFVASGVTLTIQKGTTIKASGSTNGKAPVLVIQQGGKINAVGTADEPITFTSAVAPAEYKDVSKHPYGLWGGLIICGKAPINTRGTKIVEGIEEGGKGTYGGNDPTDNSGTLQYVRVWHGGAVIGKDNEINGITFAGVGKGTKVSHIEVAFNADDGVEFFGGTVDVKYMSVMYAEDDAIDTDEGYQGRIQFAFVVLGKNSHHGTEMDSKEEKDANDQTRSFPQLYNALFVSHLQHSPESRMSDDLIPAVMRLREGTGGEFGNIIMTNVVNVGIHQDKCAGEIRTSNLPRPEFGRPGYLWFSQNNIIYGPGMAFQLNPGCGGISNIIRDDPNLGSIPSEPDPTMLAIDPRPLPNGAAFENIDQVPQDDFFEDVTFKGAFGSEESGNWLQKFSFLSVADKLYYSGTPEVKRVVQKETVTVTSTSKEQDDSLAAIIGGIVGFVALVGIICSAYMFYQRALIKRQYDRLVSDFQRSQMEMEMSSRTGSVAGATV